MKAFKSRGEGGGDELITHDEKSPVFVRFKGLTVRLVVLHRLRKVSWVHV